MRAALSDRLLLSEAIEIVGKMLRGYANGGQQASRSYIGALAEVLSSYPRCVASQAGDLVKGVPRETKFLPTPADVISWCEREVEFLRGIVARDDREKALAAAAKQSAADDAKLEAARKLRPTLQQMQEKHGPRWGLGETVKEDLRVKEATTAQIASANLRTFERECAAAGVPATVSPALRELLRDQELMRDRVPAE